MNLNLKYVLAIIGISASTTVLTILTFNKYIKPTERFNDGKLPANYTNYFAGNAPASTVDFTPAANAEDGIALIKDYNETLKENFPVRAFILPVEKSV